jgi:hypothetical protein
VSKPVKFYWDAASVTLESVEGTRTPFPAAWLRDQCHELEPSPA